MSDNSSTLKICKGCHKKFIPRIGQQYYCSYNCRCRTKSKKRGARNNELRNIILSIFDFQCQFCHSDKNLVIHHIIPKEDGGRNVIANITVLCQRCHVNLHTGFFEKQLDKIALHT